MNTDPKYINSYFYLRQLVCQYPRALDRRDYELLARLFTKDATFALPHFKANYANPEEILKNLKGVESFDRTYHMIHNHTFDIDTARNEASGEVYCTAAHFSTDDKGQKLKYDIGIRYQDRYAVEDDNWRFRSRELLVDWEQTTILSSP